MKRQPTKWEQIFANQIPDKELILKIYKEFIQLKRKKNPIIIKWPEDLSVHLSKDDTQMTN